MEKEIEYLVEGKKHVGYCAYKSKDKRPLVLVCHAFEGRNEVAEEYARFFSELGYVGFAVDMFGEKQIETTLNGCMQKITPFFENRELVSVCLNPAIEVVASQSFVDKNNIGAIGFCFGGMCVLDLARNSNRIKGVISVHGILSSPDNYNLDKISSKVLALHGYKDPQVPQDQIEDFMKEMDNKNADWQLHYYGLAKHAFTDPKASLIGSKEMGREYNEKATGRMKKTALTFFNEIFSS